MKKCPNCGKESDSKFCPECGTQMTEFEAEVIQETSQEPPPEAPEEDMRPDEPEEDLPIENPSEEVVQSVPTATYNDPRANFKSTGQAAPKEGVSGKTWFIVLFLIIFWPVGLYLMWSQKKFTKVARIIITVIIGILFVIGLFGIFGDPDASSDYTPETVETQEETQPETEAETAAPTTEATTLGERNALSKAYDYLDFMAFSHSGLIDQLEYEGFTTEEATYAADHCGADWNEQAAKKAQEYIDYTSFSRSGLIEQLEYEGFTYEQAVYGVNAVGY